MIQRYDLVRYDAVGAAVQDNQGEYVRYADIEPLLKLASEPCECDVDFAGGTSMLGSITLHTTIRKCERCQAIAKFQEPPKGTE